MIREGEAILHDDELPTSEHLLDASEDALDVIDEEQLGLDL
jgi:chromosome partition protein MukE